MVIKTLPSTSNLYSIGEFETFMRYYYYDRYNRPDEELDEDLNATLPNVTDIQVAVVVVGVVVVGVVVVGVVVVGVVVVGVVVVGEVIIIVCVMVTIVAILVGVVIAVKVSFSGVVKIMF